MTAGLGQGTLTGGLTYPRLLCSQGLLLGPSGLLPDWGGD